MGRCITAENREIRMANIHAMFNEPYKSTAKPPIKDPKNAPNWCETITIPKRVDKYLVPNKLATIPDVGGTVESHKSPMTQLKAIMITGLVGSTINKKITIERVA